MNCGIACEAASEWRGLQTVFWPWHQYVIGISKAISIMIPCPVEIDITAQMQNGLIKGLFLRCHMATLWGISWARDPYSKTRCKR